MWTCPKCASKVDREFEVCWHCGTAPDGTEDPNFVPADLEGPIDELPIGNSPDLDFGGPAPGSNLVPCYQAYSLMEAKFLADQLTEAGIEAVSDEMDMQDALGGWSGNPRVYCREGNLAKADVFLREYEKRRASITRRNLESKRDSPQSTQRSRREKEERYFSRKFSPLFSLRDLCVLCGESLFSPQGMLKR